MFQQCSVDENGRHPDPTKLQSNTLLDYLHAWLTSNTAADLLQHGIIFRMAHNARLPKHPTPSSPPSNT
nr:hypothetical protein HmN_000510500 [Hymenolepis microstoma]CUU97759.1 hypothetical transcript [Hymenolepis microstoma]